MFWRDNVRGRNNNCAVYVVDRRDFKPGVLKYQSQCFFAKSKIVAWVAMDRKCLMAFYKEYTAWG